MPFTLTTALQVRLLHVTFSWYWKRNSKNKPKARSQSDTTAAKKKQFTAVTVDLRVTYWASETPAVIKVTWSEKLYINRQITWVSSRITLNLYQYNNFWNIRVYNRETKNDENRCMKIFGIRDFNWVLNGQWENVKLNICLWILYIVIVDALSLGILKMKLQ